MQFMQFFYSPPPRRKPGLQDVLIHLLHKGTNVFGGVKEPVQTPRWFFSVRVGILSQFYSKTCYLDRHC